MRALNGMPSGHIVRRWGRVVAGLLVPATLLLSGCGTNVPGLASVTAGAGAAAVGTAETAASPSSAIATTPSADSARSAVSTKTGAATSASPASAAATDAGASTSVGRAAVPAKPGPSGAPPAPGGFGNVDACKLVTRAEAAALLGGPAHASVVGDSTSDGSFSQSCMYSLGAGAVGSALGALGAATPQSGGERSGTLMIEIHPASGAAWFKRDQGKVETGIGDQYFLAGVGRAGNAQSGGITVLKGDVAVGIGVLTDPSKALSADQYRELGRKVVARLPEQASGPAPARPTFVPGKPAAATPTPAPSVAEAALPAVPTTSPAAQAVTASLQAALTAAQAGDLAKARAAYAPVAQQWAAIPNDGKLATTDLYAAIATGIQQTDSVMASADTDAPAAASALSDLADGMAAAMASAQTTALAAAMAPQTAAFGTAVAGIPTPIAESADQNAACGLITKAEADAVLGGGAEVQALPSFDSGARSCRFVLSPSSAPSSGPTSAPNCTTGTNGDTSCVGVVGAVDVTKTGLIAVELHRAGGAQWYAENEQRMQGYRSGSDIGDQFYALGALTIWVLKGDQAFSITMPPSVDTAGTPIGEMKGLATKAASRLR